MAKYVIRYNGRKLKVYGSRKVVLNTEVTPISGEDIPVIPPQVDPITTANIVFANSTTWGLVPNDTTIMKEYELTMNGKSGTMKLTPNTMNYSECIVTDQMLMTFFNFTVPDNTIQNFTINVCAVSNEGNRTPTVSSVISIAGRVVDNLTNYTPIVQIINNEIDWGVYNEDSTPYTVYYSVDGTTFESTNANTILTTTNLKNTFSLAANTYTLYIKFGRNGNFSNVGTTTFTITNAAVYDPTKAVNWDKTYFHDMHEVYMSLHAGDKVSFVLRHGERNDNDTSSNAAITPRGQVALLCAGSKLTGNTEFENSMESSSDFKLFGSHAIRTSHTTILLAKGAGLNTDALFSQSGQGSDTISYCKNTDGTTQQNFFNSANNHVINIYGEGRSSNNPESDCAKDWMTGDKWDISGSDWPVKARTPYESDLSNKLNSFINWIITKSTASINLFGSHDFNMIPAVITLSNKQITPDLKFHQNNHWISYASGFAVIQRAGDTNHEHIEIVPVVTLTNIGPASSGGWSTSDLQCARQGVFPGTNDAYHPNNNYRYAYDVNGQIQYDITTYNSSVEAHTYS